MSRIRASYRGAIGHGWGHGWRAGFFAAMLSMLALIAPGSDALAAANSPLRIGFQKSSINILVARQLGLFERHFPGREIDYSEFPAGPQLLEALGAGSVDFGMTGDTPPVFAQAAGNSLLYVGVEPPKPQNSAILVPQGSALKSLADLKGKRLGFQKGSSAHYLVLSALKSAGLKFSDIQPVYLTPSDARAAFVRGDLDAWAIWDPYWAAAEQVTAVQVLSDGRGLSDNNTFYLASRAIAGAEPQTIAGLFAALSEADVYVQSHHHDAVLLIAKATGLDEAVAETFVSRRPPSPVAPLTAGVIATQQRIADAYTEAGLIPAALKVADAVWQPPPVTH